MTKKLAAMGASLALVLAIATAFSGEAASARVLISAGFLADVYSPHQSSARLGERIIWRNKDETDQHTVTAYGGGWSKNTTLDPGDKTSFNFHHAGTYFFRCRFHSTMSGGVCSGMCGRIKVGVRHPGRGRTVKA